MPTRTGRTGTAGGRPRESCARGAGPGPRAGSRPRSRSSRASKPKRPQTEDHRRSAMAHGEINHIEFPADDPQRAMRFYEAVAGWEFSPIEGFDEYWVLSSGEGYGGAVGKRGVSTGTVLR